MNCPVCSGVALMMTERQGVEIDYCPQCRGIWLDRGELDKLIERSAAAPGRTPPVADPRLAPPPVDPRLDPRLRPGYRSDDDDDDDDERYGHRRRKKNFLGELFDF